MPKKDSTIVDRGIHSFIISKDLEPQRSKRATDNRYMNDEFKLVAAFLALNAGVIALAAAGYAKGGMSITAVLQHLS
jgi:hypothetical protein